MRKFKQISLALAIMLALSTGAMAGIIECPPAPTPTPEPQSAMATATIDTPPGSQVTEESSDPVIDLALTLMRSVLSVF